VNSVQGIAPLADAVLALKAKLDATSKIKVNIGYALTAVLKNAAAEPP
jgi:hypothetical protein